MGPLVVHQGELGQAQNGEELHEEGQVAASPETQRAPVPEDPYQDRIGQKTCFQDPPIDHRIGIQEPASFSRFRPMASMASSVCMTSSRVER